MKVPLVLAAALSLSSLDGVKSFQQPLYLKKSGGLNTKLHTLSMKSEDNEITKSLSKMGEVMKGCAIAGAFLAGSLLGPDASEAAQSGGRSGGKSFNTPTRSRQEATRQYATPPAQTYAAPAIVPVPVMPFSPFGGFGFGYSPFGFSPFGFGMGFGLGAAPLSLLLLGVVSYGIITAMRGGLSSGWADIDGDDYSSLGQGVSVAKVQVALSVQDRSESSLLGALKSVSNYDLNDRESLSELLTTVSLELLRQKSNWIAATTDLSYSRQGGAESESKFNQFSLNERMKVEKENKLYTSTDMTVPTTAVVTLLVALKGNSLKSLNMDKPVNGVTGLSQILQQLASDAGTDEGNNVLATEIVWTPDDPTEILMKEDLYASYPELIDL